MQKYNIGEFIGEGAFSEVYVATDVNDGKPYALKIFKHHISNLEEVLSLPEVSALQQLRGHQHIVDLHDLIFDRHHAALVLTLMDSSVYDIIRSARSPIPDDIIIYWMYQLFEALAFMHSKGLFHRDIKPENILITGKVLKLGDLGSCGNMHKERPHTHYISTRWYRPPECILTPGYYTNKMDIWAAACVLYELLSSEPLFPGRNSIDQINLIHKTVGTPDDDVIGQMTRCSRDGLHGMKFPPIQGSGFTNLLMERPPYFKNILGQLLTYQPQLRPSANTVLRVVFPLHCASKPPVVNEINIGGIDDNDHKCPKGRRRNILQVLRPYMLSNRRNMKLEKTGMMRRHMHALSIDTIQPQHTQSNWNFDRSPVPAINLARGPHRLSRSLSLGSLE